MNFSFVNLSSQHDPLCHISLYLLLNSCHVGSLKWREAVKTVAPKTIGAAEGYVYRATQRYRVGGRPRGDRNGSRVNNNTSLLTMCFRKGALACIWSTWTLNAIQIDTAQNSIFKLVSGGISHATSVFLPVIHGGQFLLNSWQQATLLKAFQRAHYHVNAHPSTDGRLADWALKYTTT